MQIATWHSRAFKSEHRKVCLWPAGGDFLEVRPVKPFCAGTKGVLLEVGVGAPCDDCVLRHHNWSPIPSQNEPRTTEEKPADCWDYRLTYRYFRCQNVRAHAEKGTLRAAMTESPQGKSKEGWVGTEPRGRKAASRKWWTRAKGMLFNLIRLSNTYVSLVLSSSCVTSIVQFWSGGLGSLTRDWTYRKTNTPCKAR